MGETDVSDKPAWLQAYVAETGLRTYPVRLETHRVEALLSVNDTVRDLMATLEDLHETRTHHRRLHLRQRVPAAGARPGREEQGLQRVRAGTARGAGAGLRVGACEAGATVSLADVTATIRRAAGVTRAHGADGLPLQDVLTDPTAFVRRPVEIEGSVQAFPHRENLDTDAIGRFYTGAVWGPYTLVEYQTGDREFYDRSTDPWQLDNSYSLHPTPGSPQALLEKWYDAHVNCRGAACNDPVPER